MCIQTQEQYAKSNNQQKIVNLPNENRHYKILITTKNNEPQGTITEIGIDGYADFF